MQTKNEVEKGHYVSCAVLQKIDPLKILYVVKLPIYSDRAHRDESNGLITGKNNTTRVVRFFHPTLQLQTTAQADANSTGDCGDNN